MPGALATRYVVMDGASKLTFRMLRTSVPDWDTLSQRFREGTARPVLLDQDRASRIAA